MNIVFVIRELCCGENGIENLFDYNKSYQKLIDLSDDKKYATLFASMIYGNTKNTLIELIHDAYNYQTYIKKIKTMLISSGMNNDDAKKTIEIFLEAFAFPKYRKVDPSKVDTIITVDGDFKTVYIGEVKNKKEHGVGEKTLYYQGKWCNYYETVWVDGVMCGYEYTKEMEFGIFEDKKYGFVSNNCLIGKTRVFASSGEEFDDIGKTLSIK